MRMRFLPVLALVIVICASVALAVSCRPADESAEAGDMQQYLNYVGTAQGEDIYVDFQPDGIWVVIGDNRWNQLGVAVLSDGRLLFASEDDGLRIVDRQKQTGESLLPPGAIASQPYVDPTSRYVAYEKPLEWTQIVHQPTAFALMVFDLESRTDKVLPVDTGPLPIVLGWLGERVVFVSDGVIRATTLDGEQTVLAEMPRYLLNLDLRNGLLPYKAEDGQWHIFDVATGRDQPLPGAANAAWRKEGLKAYGDGRWELVPGTEVGPG